MIAPAAKLGMRILKWTLSPEVRGREKEESGKTSKSNSSLTNDGEPKDGWWVGLALSHLLLLVNSLTIPRFLTNKTQAMRNNEVTDEQLCQKDVSDITRKSMMEKVHANKKIICMISMARDV